MSCDFEFKTFYQCWNSHEERVNEEVKEEEDTIMTSGWNFKSLTFNVIICQYIHQLDEQNTLIIHSLGTETYWSLINSLNA